MKIGVRIMATTKRTEFLKPMLDKLNMTDDIIVYNDNTTPYRAFISTVRTALDDDITHLVVLQDDLDLINDFIPAIEKITNNFPDAIFSLANFQLKTVDLQVPYVKNAKYGIWGQANVIPKKYLQFMLDWFDEWIKEDNKHDDSALSNFARINEIDVMTTTPSLVQHLAPMQSIIGYNNKHKTSKVWIGENIPINIFDTYRMSNSNLAFNSDKCLKEEKKNGY